jgi:geranylgeranyl pyrophosphate synthase
MNLFTPYEEAFNAYMESYLPSSGQFAETTRYALFSGGKRLRPWSLFAVLESYDIPYLQGIPFSAALEFVHTYSLIHDDLPCMDNDTLRRGRPTLHKQFDEATALMTGNLLLSLAFEMIQDSKEAKFLTKVLSEACGAEGLLGGQLKDLYKETCSARLLFSQKTGALFQAALWGGSILATTNQAQRDIWRECGLALGILYQVADDFQDGDSSFSLEELTHLKEESVHQIQNASQTLLHFPDSLTLFVNRLKQQCGVLHDPLTSLS